MSDTILHFSRVTNCNKMYRVMTFVRNVSRLIQPSTERVSHQFPIKGAGLGAGSLEDEPEGGASGVAFSRWSWLNQEASGR